MCVAQNKISDSRRRVREALAKNDQHSTYYPNFATTTMLSIQIFKIAVSKSLPCSKIQQRLSLHLI